MTDEYGLSSKRQERALMLCISMGAFMVSLDVGIVNIALPMISRDFGTSIALTSKIALVYLVVIASFIPMFGKLADNRGYKNLFVGGGVLFVIGSLSCALAPDIYTLIASRAVQGLGSAITIPLSYALISVYFSQNERGKLFAKLSMWVSLGLVVGPAIGGLLTHYLGWRSIFLINVPIGIFRTFLAIAAIPKDKKNVSKSHIYLRDSSLLFMFFICLISMREVFEAQWLHYQIITLGLALMAVLTFLFLVLLQRQSTDPLINLGLFQNKIFKLGNIVNFGSALFWSGLFFIIPFFLMDGRGDSAHEAGLLCAIAGLATFAVSPLAGRLTKRYQVGKIVPGAILLLGCALFTLLFFHIQSTILIFIAAMIGLGTGLGLLKPPNQALIMNSAPEQLKGQASSLMSLLFNSGNILGIFLFEIVFILSLPGSADKHSHSLKHLHLPGKDLVLAWQHVVYFALILLFFCLVFAVLNLKTERD